MTLDDNLTIAMIMAQTGKDPFIREPMKKIEKVLSTGTYDVLMAPEWFFVK